MLRVWTAPTLVNREAAALVVVDVEERRGRREERRALVWALREATSQAKVQARGAVRLVEVERSTEDAAVAGRMSRLEAVIVCVCMCCVVCRHESLGRAAKPCVDIFRFEEPWPSRVGCWVGG